MLNNPILYRVLAHPFLYAWIPAAIFPLLLWAVLVKLAHRHPGLLQHVFPWLRGLAWGLWASAGAWGLYGLFGIPERKTFYQLNSVFFALVGGTHLMYDWVRRRVNSKAYTKKADEGWWPVQKGSSDDNPGKIL
jgi:hypothetical protein